MIPTIYDLAKERAADRFMEVERHRMVQEAKAAAREERIATRTATVLANGRPGGPPRGNAANAPTTSMTRPARGQDLADTVIIGAGGSDMRTGSPGTVEPPPSSFRCPHLQNTALDTPTSINPNPKGDGQCIFVVGHPHPGAATLATATVEGATQYLITESVALVGHGSTHRAEVLQAREVSQVGQGLGRSAGFQK